MMKTTEADSTVRRITELHNRLMAAITEKDGCRAACPNCGTTFLVRPDQTRGICFNCMEPVSVPDALRNALAKSAYPEISSYAALRQLAEDQLHTGDFSAARKTYTALLAADEKDAQAWRGLLTAMTKNYSDLDSKPPEAVYSRALAFSSAAAAGSLQAQWRLYVREYERRRQQQARAEREREAQKRRVEEEERRAKAQEQRARQAAQREGSRKPEGKGAAAARIILRLLLIGGGLLLVIALLASGAGFFGIMLLFGLFGSFGRNNNNNNRRGR